MPLFNVWSTMLRTSGEPKKMAQLHVLQALERCHGSIPNLAAHLGCSERTAYRIVALAGLADRAAKLRHDAGLHDPVNQGKFP